MLYGTYPFDEAASRELAIQQVRRATTSSATASAIPLLSQTPSWRHRLPEFRYPP